MDLLFAALPASARAFVLDALAPGWAPLLPRVLSLAPHAQQLEGALLKALGAAIDALAQMATPLSGWL